MGFREVVLGAVGYVLMYRTPLAKALIVPFAVYMLLDASMTMGLEVPWPFSLVFFVLYVAAHTVFAVTTHRIVLLGPNAVPEWGLRRWSMRESLFAMHLIGLVLIVVAVAMILSLAPVGWLLALLAATWLSARLSLVFPGIAIDHGVSFKLSWHLTHKRQILMLLVIVAFPVILLVPAVLLAYLPYTSVLSSFLTTLTTVFTVAALSIAYRIACQEQYGS